MKLALALMGFAILIVPCRTEAQTSEPVSVAVEPPPVFDRPVSWKLLVPNLLSDQERIWTFPAKLAQGQDWIPTLAVLGTTAGLIASDPSEGAYFHRTQTFHSFNKIFSGTATGVGILATPASLYALGLIRRDSKMQRTALLATESLIDAGILTTVLKDVTNRIPPDRIPTGGNYSDGWFKSGGSLLRGRGSFPSGHTIAAFSVATVAARRYENHRWVPYAAYAMAAVVGFSRLSLSVHFLSDVFMGGALGYSISRFTVLRQ